MDVLVFARTATQSTPAMFVGPPTESPTVSRYTGMAAITAARSGSESESESMDSDDEEEAIDSALGVDTPSSAALPFSQSVTTASQGSLEADQWTNQFHGFERPGHGVPEIANWVEDTVGVGFCEVGSLYSTCTHRCRAITYALGRTTTPPRANP